MNDVFAVVDEEVHDGFGDLICDGFADDIEVGGNESLDEFGFEGFPVGEGRFGIFVGL